MCKNVRLSNLFLDISRSWNGDLHGATAQDRRSPDEGSASFSVMELTGRKEAVLMRVQSKGRKEKDTNTTDERMDRHACHGTYFEFYSFSVFAS